MNEHEFVWARKCKECIHCKTRSFKEAELFINWVVKVMDVRIYAKWNAKINSGSAIKAYWCNLRPGEKRISVNPPGFACRIKKRVCHYWEGDDEQEEI